MTYLIVASNKKVTCRPPARHAVRLLSLACDRMPAHTLCGCQWMSDTSRWTQQRRYEVPEYVRRHLTCRRCVRSLLKEVKAQRDARHNPEHIGPIVDRVMDDLRFIQSDPHVTSLIGDPAV